MTWNDLRVHDGPAGIITLPKFNMESKNDGFQKESPIRGCHFQVNHGKLWG